MFSKMNGTAMALAMVLGGVAAQPASAATKVIEFTINGGSWNHINGVNAPYGLPLQPTISGSVTIDDTLTDSSGFLDLDYVTGTRTWTVADIAANSRIYYSGGNIFSAFYLSFTNYGGGVGSNNTAVIAEGPNTIYCNGCVTITSIHDPAPPPPAGAVPEPATWFLSILGFGMLGSALRRQARCVTA